MVCIIIILVFYSADDLNKNILLTIKPLNTILLFFLHCSIFLIHDDIHAAVQHNIQAVSQNIFSTSEIKQILLCLQRLRLFLEVTCWYAVLRLSVRLMLTLTRIYVRLSTGVTTPSLTSASRSMELGRSVGSLHSMASVYVLMFWLATLWTTWSCQSTVTPVSCKRQRICLKLSWQHGERSTLQTVAGTTISPVSPWCRRQQRSCGNTQRKSSVFAMWRCWVTVTLLHTKLCMTLPHMVRRSSTSCSVWTMCTSVWALHCRSWQRKSGWDTEDWQADGKHVRQPAEFLLRCHPE